MQHSISMTSEQMVLSKAHENKLPIWPSAVSGTTRLHVAEGPFQTVSAGVGKEARQERA